VTASDDIAQYNKYDNRHQYIGDTNGNNGTDKKRKENRTKPVVEALFRAFTLSLLMVEVTLQVRILLSPFRITGATNCGRISRLGATLDASSY
jgi:hypothetical protein